MQHHATTYIAHVT